MSNTCPKCGSKDVHKIAMDRYRCNYCRHEFEEGSIPYFETYIEEINSVIEDRNRKLENPEDLNNEKRISQNYESAETLKNTLNHSTLVLMEKYMDELSSKLSSLIANTHINTTHADRSPIERVYFFLYDIKPPEYIAAAATIRSYVEETLKNHPKIVCSPPQYKDELAEFRFRQWFPKNESLVVKASSYWRTLNNFMHKNQDKIANKFDSEAEKNQYIMNAANFFKKFSLMPT